MLTQLKTFVAALVPALANINKATATAIVSWVAANIGLGLLHVQIGAEWQTLGVTALLAIVHGAIVWAVPNYKLPA